MRKAIRRARSNQSLLLQHFQVSIPGNAAQSQNCSRFQDANFAQETSNLTRAQILVSAGTSVLSTANSTPQAVLKLLA